MTRPSVWMASGAIAVALACAGCGQGGAGSDPAPSQRVAILAPTDVSPVRRSDVRAGVPVSGTLEPSVDIQITAPFPQVLDRVLVREGQKVRKGNVLARFRDDAIRPRYESAQAQQATAAADYDRMKNLFAAGAVSRHDLESAEAALKAADAAKVEAQQRLEDATVSAPADGVIAKRWVQTGDRVGDGDPLFRLVDTAELDFEATVPSSDASRIRPGLPVVLQVTNEDVSIRGRVARVNATADPATRQVKVYVTVPNRDHRLVGDVYATGRIVLDTVEQALAVPSLAVHTDDDGRSYVWIVQADTLDRREVTVGAHDELQDLVALTAGVSEGEIAIVTPMQGLVKGQRVRIAGGES